MSNQATNKLVQAILIYTVILFISVCLIAVSIEIYKHPENISIGTGL